MHGWDARESAFGMWHLWGYKRERASIEPPIKHRVGRAAQRA